MNKILVAYITNCGTTRDVAEDVAEEINKAGYQAEVKTLTEVEETESYAAVVLGAPMIIGWHNPDLPAHSLGFVYLPALLGIALTSMFFARFGARLAHKLSPRLLKRLFAALLFCVGLSFLL